MIQLKLRAGSRPANAPCQSANPALDSLSRLPTNRPTDQIDALHHSPKIAATQQGSRAVDMAGLAELKLMTQSKALPAAPSRMEALEREIRSLTDSRKKVAEEALARANRDEPWELDVRSMLQMGRQIMKAQLQANFVGMEGPTHPDLELHIDAWLNSWLPARGAGSRVDTLTPAEQFLRAAEDTFRRIEQAVRPQACATDALEALAGFLHLLSRLEVQSFGTMARGNIVRALSFHLLSANLDRQFSFTLLRPVPGFVLDSENASALAGSTAQHFEAALKKLSQCYAREAAQMNLKLDGTACDAECLPLGHYQLQLLAEYFGTHKKAFIAMLTAAEENIASNLRVAEPMQIKHGEIGKMDAMIATDPGAIYDRMIKRLTTS